jgi:AraC-like DNA-binding protein
MHYLANWRMQVGAALLRDTAATVMSMALEIGYESEAALSRAFKRSVGKPPSLLWRRQTQSQAQSAPALDDQT